MSRLQFVQRPVFLVAALAIAVGACGPSELATPSAAQVERLIGATFPEASVRVREVNREEQTLRVPAEFDDADVVFLMAAGEEEWELAGVEQGGSTYTVEQLGQIATTMGTMRLLSDSLEAYRSATGSYPALDDLVGLRELVPDHYSVDGSLEDAWGSPFRYRPQGSSDYTVTSAGPDGEAGSRDDIILITGSFGGADA